MSRPSGPARTKRGRGGFRLPASARGGSQSSQPEQFSRSNVLSQYSTGVVPESLWYCSDFRLAASLVIIQPSSGRVVLVHDTAKDYWFLPRGRKDVGESLEQAALREGYEESGYRATFLPLLLPSGAPVPPDARASDDGLRTEPIYIRAMGIPSIVDQANRIRSRGEEYIVFFYVGQIPENAIREEGTGMADEQAYVGKLVTPEEAREHLAYDQFLQMVVDVALERWRETEQHLVSRREGAHDLQSTRWTGSTADATAGGASTSTQAARSAPQGRFSGWFRRSGSVG
ncbi:hypothetical protein PENSPDRAFT_657313 [Peniophora sp. CONT]|nr:hypothetical protein PENSPDRAFT_657313 [Peniophora sp. CONT]